MLPHRTQLNTYDPFLAPRRWMLRLGARFYYPIAAVALTLIVGIVARDALGGHERIRRLVDLALVGGACALVLFWRAERMWLRGQINWLVRIARPRAAFLWSGIAVTLIALGLVAFVRITGPNSTAANHLWPLFLFPLLFLAERGNTVPFLFMTGVTCGLLTLLRFSVSNTLSGVLTPPLWLATLATSNYYLTRRSLLLELRTELLRQIANQLSNTPNIEASFQSIAEMIGYRLRLQHVRLWVLDLGHARLNLHAVYGTPKEKWDGFSLPITSGIPGAVVRERRPERWDNTRQCPYHLPETAFAWVRSALAVPILVADQVVGVLEILSPNEAEFWELDVEQMTLMADSIGIALARSQHGQREAERLRDTLWHAVSRLSDCTTLEEMFDEVAREARDHLDADLVVLYQLAPGTGYPLTPPLFMGDFRDPETLRQPTLPPDSVLFDLLARWEPYYSTEAQADLLLSKGLESPEAPVASDALAPTRPSSREATVPYGRRNRFIFREAVRSAAFLPLGSRTERVGALFLHYRARREFSPLDKLTLEAFASLVAEQIIRERAHWRKYEAFGGVLFGVHGPLTLSADSLRRLTGSARDALRTDPDTAEAALDQAQQVARKRELAAMLTRLSQRDQLDGESLREEMRRAAAKIVQFVEPHEVCRIQTDIPDEADDLPIEVLDAMYCLAMEAVVNAAFHGHAKRIDIGVEVEQTRICLRVADNGQGFNPESARHGPNGIFEGLELVRQQFAAEGRIESQPGAGARVEVIFPCLADVVSVE